MNKEIKLHDYVVAIRDIGKDIPEGVVGRVVDTDYYDLLNICMVRWERSDPRWGFDGYSRTVLKDDIKRIDVRPQFRVGDRVTVLKHDDDTNNIISPADKDTCGIIKAVVFYRSRFADVSYCVEFDEKVGGHSGVGYIDGKEGHCWMISGCYLKLEQKILFGIGDRVMSKQSSPKLSAGMLGTVVDINADVRWKTGFDYLKIEWDEYVCGHSCDGLAKKGYGWNVWSDTVEKLCYLEIGDRVEATADYDKKVKKGMKGKIVTLRHKHRECYGIEWDEYIGGHTCFGAAQKGYGYWVPYGSIKKIDCKDTKDIKNVESKPRVGGIVYNKTRPVINKDNLYRVGTIIGIGKTDVAVQYGLQDCYHHSSLENLVPIESGSPKFRHGDVVKVCKQLNIDTTQPIAEEKEYLVYAAYYFVHKSAQNEFVYLVRSTDSNKPYSWHLIKECDMWKVEDYRVGDEVVMIANNTTVRKGLRGTIVKTGIKQLSGCVGVEWEEEVENGHSLNSSAKRGHGGWVSCKNLKNITDMERGRN